MNIRDQVFSAASRVYFLPLLAPGGGARRRMATVPLLLAVARCWPSGLKALPGQPPSESQHVQVRGLRIPLPTGVILSICASKH
jgi:hypothetical protein